MDVLVHTGLQSLSLAEDPIGGMMIFLWLVLVVLLSFVLFSVVLVWGRLGSEMSVSVLCLLQSVAEHFDACSESFARRLHRL
jgi:hypothetical protein